MTDKACLGGWCRIRANCPHYNAEDRSEPSERLCERGRDGVIADATPVRVAMLEPGEWPELEAA